MIKTGNFSIKDFISNRGLTFVWSIVSVAILAIYIHLFPVIMILWVLSWIIENKSGLSKDIFYNNKAATLFLLFIAFYLWQVSGLLLADSLNTGIERLVKRLSFVFLPLVLFYPGQRIIKNINLIVRLFAFCIFLYVLYCFWNAINHSVIIQDNKIIFNPHPPEYSYENYFFSLRFAAPVHPSYLAMYIMIAVLIIFESFFDNNFKPFCKKVFAVTLVPLFTGLFLLSARAGFLAGIIILPLYFYLKYSNRIPKWKLILFLGALLFIFLSISKKNERVNYAIKDISKQNIDSTLKKDQRLLIWQSAVGVIKNHPILGVGTGDASDKLKEEYNARGNSEGENSNLNAHNQFLEIWIENGLVGLLLFLTILGFMFYIAIGQKNILFGMFSVTVIIFFMFETMLNRLAGVSFFSLFSFLLIYTGTKPLDTD